MPDHDYRLWVGGDRAPGAHGRYEIVNPATESTVGFAPEASADDARRAAEAAAGAFGAWSASPPTRRAALLDRAADLLQARFDELVALAQAETGGTATMSSMANVGGAVARLRRYARGALEPTEIPLAPAPSPPGPLNPRGGLTGALAVRRPVGVVACITSYNVPLTNVVGKIGPALAMGNTVVVKPAPQDPLAVIRLVEVLHEAGFPPGVVNLVVGSTPESAEALVSSPDVDMVSFTGSTAVGQRIGAVAGGSTKRLLLELGGKGASIVFPGADLAAAAMGTASTFTFHAGQICTAPTRLIAHRSVYDELVGRLAAIAGGVKVGDPTEPDTVVGPVISAAQRERVEAHIRSGVDAGGELVAGGERPDLDRGFFVRPTLLAGCSPDMEIARQEIFGPVVVAIPFDDEEEAVAIANSTEFGLYDYVWSPDTSHALAVAARLRTGNVGLTRWVATRRHRSAGSSRAASAVTAGRSRCTRTASCRAWSGRDEQRGVDDEEAGMRAIVWTGDLEVRDDVEVAGPGPRDVVVRIHHAGLCHSDVSVINGTIPFPTPVVLGHEGAGVVEAVGSAVTRVRPGDHVVLTTLGNCGQCDACDRGQPTHCRSSFGSMVQRFRAGGEPAYQFANTGVFAERTVVGEHQAVVIDRQVPLASACLIGCAVVTGAGAVLNRAKVQPGQTVLVIGAGGIGQSVIQAARLSNASRIVVVDANPAKRDVALEFGATDFVDASAVDDTVAAVRELGLPDGVDHSFECVGHPQLIRTAIDLLDWGGTCTLLGVPKLGTEASFVVAGLYNNKSILGCRYGATRPHHDVPLLVRLYLDGRFQLDQMVTKRYDLADIHVALDDMQAGRLNRGVLDLI